MANVKKGINDTRSVSISAGRDPIRNPPSHQVISNRFLTKSSVDIPSRHVDSGIVSRKLEIVSKKNSHAFHTQAFNNLEHEKNSSICIHDSHIQSTSSLENASSPIHTPLHESNDLEVEHDVNISSIHSNSLSNLSNFDYSSHMKGKEVTDSAMSENLSPLLEIPKSMKNKTGKINTRNNAYLENSLVALSESIQNRIANHPYNILRAYMKQIARKNESYYTSKSLSRCVVI